MPSASWHDLTEAVERAVTRHCCCLQEPPPQLACAAVFRLDAGAPFPVLRPGGPDSGDQSRPAAGRPPPASSRWPDRPGRPNQPSPCWGSSGQGRTAASSAATSPGSSPPAGTGPAHAAGSEPGCGNKISPVPGVRAGSVTSHGPRSPASPPAAPSHRCRDPARTRAPGTRGAHCHRRSLRLRSRCAGRFVAETSGQARDLTSLVLLWARAAACRSATRCARCSTARPGLARIGTWLGTPSLSKTRAIEAWARITRSTCGSSARSPARTSSSCRAMSPSWSTANAPSHRWATTVTDAPMAAARARTSSVVGFIVVRSVASTPTRRAARTALSAIALSTRSSGSGDVAASVSTAGPSEEQVTITASAPCMASASTCRARRCSDAGGQPARRDRVP